MKELTYADALREALREEMIRDPNVILLGEEIGVFNGVYKVTRGLLDEFGPERVRDTPISEAAIAGAAVGLALSGMKPVAEIMYMDFLPICMDQLSTQAAKMRFMSGGQLNVPMVLRTQYSLAAARISTLAIYSRMVSAIAWDESGSSFRPQRRERPAEVGNS